MTYEFVNIKLPLRPGEIRTGNAEEEGVTGKVDLAYNTFSLLQDFVTDDTGNVAMEYVPEIWVMALEQNFELHH